MSDVTVLNLDNREQLIISFKYLSPKMLHSSLCSVLQFWASGVTVF